MKYVGETVDPQGQTIGVEIITSGASVPVRRLDAGDIRLPKESPVTIEGETNDLFDELVTQSATVALLTRQFVPDLFRADPRGATVRITRAGVCIFRGYVLPRTYSQEYSRSFDRLEINCIDALSVLRQLKWRDIGASGVDWDEERRVCGMITLREVVRRALAQAGGGRLEVLSSPTMTEGGLSALDGVSVDETLFMGDSEEDTWTTADVLSEALRYLNRHIMQRGDGFVLFSWDDIRQRPAWRLTRGECRAPGATIEVGEIYNRITVSCDMESEEEFIPDPLDTETCTSPYPRPQPYLTEFCADWSKDEDGNRAVHSFAELMRGKRYPDVRSTAVWRRDWWVRVMETPGWRFYSYGEGREWDFTIPRNGHIPRGMEAKWLYYPGRISGGERQNRVPDDVVQQRGVAIIQTQNGKTEYDPNDNAVPGSLDTSVSMVIGVHGDGKVIDMSDESDDPTFIGKRACMPLAVYTGVSVNLSPADSQTIRFLDISGKIALAPVVKVNSTWDAAHEYFNSPEASDLLAGAMTQNPYGEDKQRVYVRCYYNPVSPLEGEMFPGSYLLSGSVNTGRHGGDSPDGLDIYHSQEAHRIVKMGASPVYQGIRFRDTISKIPVLTCMLLIGDKCLVETSLGNSPRDYRWDTFKERSECASDREFLQQTFTIGFDPKIGDFLIGPEYDIAKNLHYAFRTEAKGTGIPIGSGDALSGEVCFMILGVNEIPYGTKHGEIYVSDDLLKHTVTDGGIYGSKIRNALRQVSAVWLRDFSIKIITDNGHDDPLEESDIVYISDTAENFINPRDDISFRICSDLTTEERRRLGVRDIVSRSTATDSGTGRGVTALWDPRLGVMAKPEQIYVDWYYRELHEPRIEIDVTIKDPGTDPMLLTWEHPSFPGRRFFPVRAGSDPVAGKLALRLRECV